jgi:hypothetical protein
MFIMTLSTIAKLLCINLGAHQWINGQRKCEIYTQQSFTWPLRMKLCHLLEITKLNKPVSQRQISRIFSHSWKPREKTKQNTQQQKEQDYETKRGKTKKV